VANLKWVLAPCVENELWTIWKFIAKDNPDVATQVVESTYETIVTLASTPTIGKLHKFRNPHLKGIRSCHVSGFHNYLIFYRIAPGEIQVLHVYHGARNIEALLDEK